MYDILYDSLILAYLQKICHIVIFYSYMVSLLILYIQKLFITETAGDDWIFVFFSEVSDNVFPGSQVLFWAFCSIHAVLYVSSAKMQYVFQQNKESTPTWYPLEVSKDTWESGYNLSKIPKSKKR